MFSVLRLRICSNRCAKPDRPSGSFFEPTSYHIEVVTLPVVASGSAITVRPLPSFHWVNSIGGAATAAGTSCAAPGVASADAALAAVRGRVRRRLGMAPVSSLTRGARLLRALRAPSTQRRFRPGVGADLAPPAVSGGGNGLPGGKTSLSPRRSHF